MIKKYKKVTAMFVFFAFTMLLGTSSMPLPAEPEMGANGSTMERADSAPLFIEREEQVGYQAAKKNILPVLLITAAVAAGVFLLVMLVSKIKYNIGGVWEFHNDYITPGYDDFDSTWTFIPYDELNPVVGSFRRSAGGKYYEGFFTIVDKKGVVFQDAGNQEEHVGAFDSKTTMSGTFQIYNGANGTWTAKKKSN